MRQHLLRIVRDPLFTFCLLGAGCFLLFDALSDDRETIIVSETVREMLIDDFEVLEGRTPDEGDEAALIERFIHEEILFREALSRGLHFGDARLRLMLIEKMRFLLADVPDEPTEEELVGYYVDHLTRYTSEPRYSLRNVYFRHAPEDPAALLSDLRDGADINGDPGFWLGDEMRAYHASVLHNVLGAAALPVIEGMAVGDWAGPIESPRGYHFIRLDAVIPSQPRRFADVRGQVREDWAAARRSDSIHQRVQQLREHYAIRGLSQPMGGP